MSFESIQETAEKYMEQASLEYCKDVCNKVKPFDPMAILTNTKQDPAYRYVRKELERALSIIQGTRKTPLTIQEVDQAIYVNISRLSAEEQEEPFIKWLIQRQGTLSERFSRLHTYQVTLETIYNNTERMEEHQCGMLPKPNPAENMSSEKRVVIDHLIGLVQDGPVTLTCRHTILLRYIIHHRLGQTFGAEHKVIIDTTNERKNQWNGRRRILAECLGVGGILPRHCSGPGSKARLCTDNDTRLCHIPKWETRKCGNPLPRHT